MEIRCVRGLGHSRPSPVGDNYFSLLSMGVNQSMLARQGCEVGVGENVEELGSVSRGKPYTRL